jgi:outer membrane protein OmpA-like peptidoglycan-associated protein
MKIQHFALMAVAATAIAGCATTKHGGYAGQGRCHDAQLTLYFDTGSDTLTDDGRKLVALSARRLQSCQVKELQLLGLSDPSGSPEANLQLSKRRADTVLDAFVRAGVPAPHYTLVAKGEQGAVAPNGAVEPVRRRVDVTVVVGR